MAGKTKKVAARPKTKSVKKGAPKIVKKTAAKRTTKKK